MYMAWTKKETKQFQMDNNKYLKEVNATLRPDKNLKGKIGIFCAGQNGDLMTAMSVLKYRNELWAGKEIIWYANFPNADALKHSPVSEVRAWLWAGNGLPIGTPDFYPLLCDENNRLNKALASQYESTKDLEDGYFPAPHQMTPEKRHGLDYPNVSRRVFGLDPSLEWHPCIYFSDQERQMAKDFIDRLPPNRKNIMMETFAGSGHSLWDDSMTQNTMRMCRERFGECNFIFTSHKYLRLNDNFPEGLFNDANGVVSCASFTVRQCALLADYCNLFVGVSSGISVASSHWDSVKVPKIQFCGSWTCSTVSLANGFIELVTADEKKLPDAQQEFYTKLKQLLNKI